MKIMHIVGNRPQFIKLAPISAEIRNRNYRECIIHTGQHFDANMSDIFFEELGIPAPDENLHVSGGSHTEMTARIMLALEPCLKRHNPDVILIYGDTNSTLAAALTARKAGVPIVHVEAGPRTGNGSNPEEINRIIADHISDILCAPDMSSQENLKREGLQDKAFFTGDVMYDAFKYTEGRAEIGPLLDKYNIRDKQYILMTWHRQENTTSRDGMLHILDMIGKLNCPVLFPVHPRTRNKIEEFGLADFVHETPNLKLILPVGYAEMVTLTRHSRLIITDSGGLSKESYFADVRCLFMADLKVWPELEKIGWIVHTTQDNEVNLEKCNKLMGMEKMGRKPSFYGDGNAAQKIVDLIGNMLI